MFCVTKRKKETFMKNLIKKIVVMSSVLGVAVLLSGCTGMCGKKAHGQKHAKAQATETVVFYQTYENADVSRVHAKMYTHSSRGGESKMGYIKFNETDSGLKMEVDLKDLRPNVTYTVKIYQCGNCSDNTCCAQNSMAIDLPKLRINHVGRLEESFIIRGLTAAQLNNAKIYLERDGGYKAAWGTMEKGMML